ncbi:MAG: PrsW family intramembrane metalloprotease [Myxococcaceae bacterium]|nr:PrsW family intramembrane metalloprotease [Myxococcaceae bacterium]
MTPQVPSPPVNPAALDSGRRTAGCLFYALGMVAGAGLLFFTFFVPAVVGDDPGRELGGMFTGALLALPALFLYVWIPWIVDRFDPEPLWTLLGALGWGAIAACGFSAVINSTLGAIGTELGGPQVGNFVSACISAPIFEELFKGLGVAGIAWFLKREFDGVVDGIIYAAFVALGFAGVENVIYYGRAAMQDMGAAGDASALAGTFFMRGLMTPWIHPLFTAMTGLGFGLARETTKGSVRFLAPLGGYVAAVVLHSIWNTAATLSGMLVLVMLPLWFLFVTGFFVIVIVLVRRKGRIIRDHLKDEVLTGHLTLAELELVTSAFSWWQATFTWGGAPARRFVEAASRLALSKWHSRRAAQGHSQTISGAFVAPLRKELQQRRDEMARSLGRALPQPAPWRPTPEQPRPPWL